MRRIILSGTLGLLAFSWSSLPSASQITTSINRPTIRIGSEGVVVSELQAALKLWGYYNGAVDGTYSESTVIAVSSFQRAAGLNPDGIVNQATWDRLFPARVGEGGMANNPSNPTSEASQQPSSLPTLKQGMRGEAVVQLQQRLNRLGLLRGSADGIFGSRTLEAVKAAQTRFNLPPDGIVGPATWRVLMDDS